MKKIISIVISLVMVVSAFAVSAVPAMAKTVISPSQTTTQKTTVIVQVNGSSTSDVSYERDPEDPNKITFTYNGDGELIGWEFPGMVEGTDYEIISEDGNSITILVSEDYDGDVIANAIVKLDEEKTTKKPGKVDGSSKSPKTGAMAATGLAVAGAGAAILAALKKKNDAE